MSREPRRIGGSGDPLVLIHGLGDSWNTWLPVLDALERRHRVLALDLPGFGDAPPLPAGVAPTVSALADHVEREMDAAGFETAHLAGNSMGGWISLELARRGRARSVVALSPAGAGTRRENAYSRRLFGVARAVTVPLAPVADAVARPALLRAILFGAFFARPTRLDPAEAAHRLRRFVRAPGFHATRDWLFSHRASGLHEVTCPVAVAWGSRDLVLLPRQAARFIAQMPHARLIRLAGLGHVPMPDDPGQVAQVILGGSVGTDEPGGARGGRFRSD